MAQTNSIATALKRDVILDKAMEAFKKAVLPLRAFSTVFRDVPLQGTNKMQVPYYPLATAASKDFEGTYVFDGTNTKEAKEITVNKRKYQPLSYTSEELARQPQFDPEKFGELRGKKLAEDVIADILSVVTVANFGAAAWNGNPADFDVLALIGLRKVANKAHWPKLMRALCLNADFEAGLMSDTNVRYANQAGTAAPLTEGEIPRVQGFDYFSSELIPDNGENLGAMMAYPSAILVGFAPVPAAPELQKVVEYFQYPDPEGSGLVLEYRAWADGDTDTVKRVIECNYGYAKGETAALKRITTAA